MTSSAFPNPFAVKADAFVTSITLHPTTPGEAIKVTFPAPVYVEAGKPYVALAELDADGAWSASILTPEAYRLWQQEHGTFEPAPGGVWEDVQAEDLVLKLDRI